MATVPTHTVIGLFHHDSQAERAIEEVMRTGISRDHVSVITPDSRKASTADTPHLLPDADVGAGSTSGTGAAVGGFFGFIAGAAALAIPGIGPFLAAGPLAAAIMGAGVGAAAGGLAGALADSHVPSEHAAKYAKEVQKGNILLAIHTDEKGAKEISKILDKNDAYDVDEDEFVDVPTPVNAAPVGTITDDSVRAARLTPDTSLRARQDSRETRAGVYPGITGGNDSSGQLQ